MRLLVLGGTRFLGRGIVDAALANGDQVTTFTRGKSGEPPDGVEALHGDRNAPDGMDVLRGREWDAVIDTSGFVPTVVGRGAALLADSVGHYVFVSSLNAYPSFGDEPIRDDSPVHDCAPDAGSPDGEFELEQYGPFKVGSERAVDQHFAGRSAHLRAGLIIGPYDASGRFPYWVDRMARGGEVLAPGRPDIDDAAGGRARPRRLGGRRGPRTDHRRVRGDRAGRAGHVRRDARRRRGGRPAPARR